MRNTRGRALVCAAVICAGGVVVANAAAAKLYVSPTGTLVATKSSCAKPVSHTIQGAVALANSNDKVIVCVGTYAEQVVVQKPLTLQGTAGVTLVPPGDSSTHFTGALILVGTPGSALPLSSVTVEGFTIDGQNRAGTAGNARDTDGPAGIRVENANAKITGNVIQNVNDADCFGCQSGDSILLHTANGVSVKDTVSGNTISNFQKAGIVADAGTVPDEPWTAGAALTGLIEQNVVTGIGPTTLTAQNGIQVSRGANTGVTGNSVSGTAYTGSPDTTATGILVYEAGPATKVSNNTVSVFDVGIDAQDSQLVTISGNTLTGGRSSDDSLDPLGCGTTVEGINADFTSATPNPTTLTISGNTVSDIKLPADLFGCQTGVGIRSGAFSSDGTPAITTAISANNVSDVQKAGIVVNGDENTGKITKNTVTGSGTQAAIAQNMIQLGFGAAGVIGGSASSGNKIIGFGAYTGPSDDSSAAILLYQQPAGVKVTGNTFQEDSGLLTPDGSGDQGGYTLIDDSASDVVATKNSWGVHSATDIAVRVYDGSDESDLGIVDDIPFS